MGNLEAVEAHLKGLKRLVYLIGGLDNMGHMTLSKLYQSDVKGAVLKGSRPIFPMSASFRREIVFASEGFHPGHASRPPPALSSLGLRFQNRLWFTDLNRAMKASIQIFRRLIIYFEKATLQPELGYTDQPGETGAEDLWSEVISAGSYLFIAPRQSVHVIPGACHPP
ncbi:hypothetical protein BDV12DRAFT_201530 [Aspergillus spectabilis]